jgi:transposase
VKASPRGIGFESNSVVGSWSTRRSMASNPPVRHFGLDRRTVRRWVRRWRVGGDIGLVPQDPERKRRLPDTTRELIRVARVEHRYGAARTQVWLKRVHQIHANTSTIRRVFREIGVPVLTKTPRRRPKQMMLFDRSAHRVRPLVPLHASRWTRRSARRPRRGSISFRTTKLYDRSNDTLTLDEIERIML